jgi:hypothetical protein
MTLAIKGAWGAAKDCRWAAVRRCRALPRPRVVGQRCAGLEGRPALEEDEEAVEDVDSVAAVV